MIPVRWFLDSDESGHGYLVPVEHAEEWETWRDLDQDDEAAWTAPAWAVPVDGGGLTFEKPRIGKEDV